MDNAIIKTTAGLMLDAGLQYHEAKQLMARGIVMQAMQRVRGNQCKAARLLGMHRNSLGRLLAEFNLPTHRRAYAIKPEAAGNPSDLRAAGSALPHVQSAADRADGRPGSGLHKPAQVSL